MNDPLLPATPPRLLLRGLDSLYVSFHLDTSINLDWDRLRAAKERCKTSRKESVEFEQWPEQFALMPYGRNRYTYVLVNKAFEVLLSERMQPSCHVRFSSEALWLEGVEALAARFERWRSIVGLNTIHPELVARADWSFDYLIPSPGIDADWFVSRASKNAIHRENRRDQTYTFGRGDIVVRVYDKSAEIAQQSGKVWFHQLWNVVDGVWRIEFQIRRDRLKEAGINTLTEMQDLQGDLLREIASNHTTLRLPNADTNHSRWPLHPWWTQLLSDIASLPQTGLVRAIDDKAALRWRLQRQLRSLYGDLKGIATILSLLDERDTPIDLASVLDELPQLLDDDATVLWRNDVARRMSDYRLGRW